MNTELIAEVLSDLPEIPTATKEKERKDVEKAEYPYYIVPRPPVPGKMGWSSTAW